jgi:hypothetical protein
LADLDPAWVMSSLVRAQRTATEPHKKLLPYPVALCALCALCASVVKTQPEWLRRLIRSPIPNLILRA